MPIIAKEEKTYEPIPTGMQHAVCAKVCDIGTHEGEYEGRKNQRHQIVVIWELAETKTEGQFAGEPFQISKFYTLSLGKKANLRLDLESWRGKKFTDEELKGFDVENLVGANCFLNIMEDGDKFKIKAVTPLPKGMEKLRQKMTVEPDWVVKKRSESMEARGLPIGTATNGTMPPAAEEDALPF